jgi:hypothetical protein
MENWQIFENNVTKFLNDTFSDITFTNTGDRDSTVPDIKVENGNKHLFVEAKYIPSQSGQIVVLMNNGQFEFSTASKNRLNTYTTQIINKLNEDFNEYSDVEQSSISIDIDTSILFGWIQQTYLDKNAKWIISSNKHTGFTKNELIFVPINEMSNYFNVSISLRRKKSGSGSVPMSRQEEVKTLCKSIFSKDIQVIKNKSYIELDALPQNIHLNDTYCLKKQPLNGNLYEIRKKGTTNNPNIMFELKLKDNFNFKEEDFREFYRQSLF